MTLSRYDAFSWGNLTDGGAVAYDGAHSTWMSLHFVRCEDTSRLRAAINFCESFMFDEDLTITDWRANSTLRTCHEAFRSWDANSLWTSYRWLKSHRIDPRCLISLDHMDCLLGIKTHHLLFMHDFLNDMQGGITADLVLCQAALFSGCAADEKIRFLICLLDSTGRGSLLQPDFDRLLDHFAFRALEAVTIKIKKASPQHVCEA